MVDASLIDNLDVIVNSKSGIALMERLFLSLTVNGKMKELIKEFDTAKVHKLGDICEIYQPKTISTSELIPNAKFLVYGANGVIGNYDKFNHEDSEVLVTCRGATCGTVNVSEPFSWINGNAMVVRPKHEWLRKDFLTLVLKSVNYETITTGTAQPQITKVPLANVEVVVPSLAAQEQVIKIVNSIFELLSKIKIEISFRDLVKDSARKSAVDAISTAQTSEDLQINWERIQDNWEVIASTPESIESLRSLIRELAVRGLITNVDRNFHTESEDPHEAPFNIPDSWSWVKLGVVIDFFNGYAFRSDEYIANGVGVVRMSDMKSGHIIQDHMKYVSIDRLRSLAETFQVKPGDIVMGMTGATLGKPCVNRTTETFLLNQRIGKFIPKGIDPDYLLLVLEHLERSFMSLSFGTGVNNLSTQQIKNSLIPLPPAKEQIQIVRMVSDLFSICDRLELQLITCEKLSSKYARSVVSASA